MAPYLDPRCVDSYEISHQPVALPNLTEITIFKLYVAWLTRLFYVLQCRSAVARYCSDDKIGLIYLPLW